MTENARFYKWHRIFGLIALVPVICWTISGMSHPLMSNWFRPYIPVEVYKEPAQNQLQVKLSIQQVLDTNRIAQLRNFRLVSFKNTAYYQVLGADSICNYYNANNGKLLNNGDQQYAEWLTRYFTRVSVSAIRAVTLQKAFDSQYQPVNHLLPVWKVSLKRPDGMDAYIETGQGRMCTFNNNTRKWMLLFFEQLHTWDFLAKIAGDTVRNIFLLCIVIVMFCSLVTGLTIYGLLWNKFKAAAKNRRTGSKDEKRFLLRYHRQIGLYVSFVMLTFFTSAGFHLAVKLHNGKPEKPQFTQLFNRTDLKLSNLQLPVPDSTIKKVGLAKIDGKTYYQVSTARKKILYFDAINATELKDGDQAFATYLGNYYRSVPANSKVTVTQVRQFTNEYGFINKRLPVQQVSYPGDENWYIETTTAKLATKVDGLDRTEGCSFIFLHKFFYMSWAGKDVRDIVSITAALGVLTVSLLGFASFLKNK